MGLYDEADVAFRTFANASRKIKLALCLISHHTLKAYGTVEVRLRAFFTSVLYAGKWSASGSGCLFPVEIIHYTSHTRFTGFERGGRDGISVPSMESRTPGHSRFVKVIGLYEFHEKCINMKRDRKKEGRNKERNRRGDRNNATNEVSSVMTA